MGTWGVSLGSEVAGSKVHHSPQPGAKVKKKERSYASTASYAFMVCIWTTLTEKILRCFYT
jgi:hypothetical protein